jgi:peptidoglycan/LPS O-acetylase OafA/YrhL
MTILIGYDASGEHQKAFELAVVLLAFPSLLAFGLLAEPPRQLKKILSFLGDLSYPIYAIHWPLLPLIVPLILKLRLGFWPSAGVYLLITILLGYAAFRFVDAPVSLWLRRKLQPPALANRAGPALSST